MTYNIDVGCVSLYCAQHDEASCKACDVRKRMSGAAYCACDCRKRLYAASYDDLYGSPSAVAQHVLEERKAESVGRGRK